MDSNSRPSWVEFFMSMARLIATRSPDPHTKHECVLVDSQHRVVSTGYNGPIAGIPNDQVPTERPDKYNWFIHAEDNAVIFAKRDLAGCIAFVTGQPCAACFRRMLQAGIRTFYIGNTVSACITPEEEAACNLMLFHTGAKRILV